MAKDTKEMGEKSAATTDAETETKRERVATKEIDVAGKTVTFTFVNGESVVCKLADVPTEMQTRLALHGMSQKIGDSFAGVAKETKESGGDVAGNAIAAAKSELAKLVKGAWAERSSSGSVKYVDLIEPLLHMAKKANKPTTREKLIANLADKKPSELSAIRQNGDYITAMAELAKGRKSDSASLAGLF